MLSRAQRNFQSNWTAIVLAVISIIQGLAFNDLAVRLPTIIDYSLASHDLVPATHFLLSFLVLLRIFQTYITAALDYDEWVTSFPDVLLIFVLGLIEYYVFSSLVVPGFLVVQFHKRISVVSILAAIGHIRAYASLKDSENPAVESYRVRERRLQSFNIGGAVAVQALSTLVLLVRPLPNPVYAAVGLVAATILAFNIGYSLTVTFSNELESTSLEQGKSAAREKLSHHALNIEIRQATRGDVPVLARLMAEHFGYMYSAVFDTSPRLTEKILATFLRAVSGKIPGIGFRSFQVACSDNPADVKGLLEVTCSSPPNFAVAFWLLAPVIVLYHLGLTGMVRAFRNARALTRYGTGDRQR